MKASFLMPGTVIDDRYQLEGIISTGSFGIVYRARDLRTQTDVAFKVLHEQARGVPQHVGRFNREGRLGSRLTHPHIVPHLDFGTIDEAHGGGPYLVLALIQGLPLGDMIDLRGPLNVQEAVHILGHVLDALHAVHCLGAIHRDLKPDNVLVALPDLPEVELDLAGSIAARVGVPEPSHPCWGDLTGAHATLLDFGLGKFLTTAGHDFTKITTTGMAAGTLYYMSPEQILAEEDLDYRADIYGAAMLFFRMLNGDPPYDGQMMVQIATSHLEAPPPSLPGGLDDHPVGAAYRRAAMKKRDQRFTSAAEMAWALRAALDPELAAQPAPTFEPPHAPAETKRSLWARLLGR
ncbi:MAG: serine/threonine-protein kinase [Myxococcota bacterium]